jgi:fatty-acyl-CoA synthase
MLRLLLEGGPASSDLTVLPDGRLSRGQVIDRSLRLARAMTSLGVAPGEPVAIFLRNSNACIEALFACWAAGAIATPLNARLRASELAYALADLRPRLVLTESAPRPGLAARLQDGLAMTAQPPMAAVLDGRPPAGMWGPAELEAAAAGGIDPTGTDDPAAGALMLYTSGTTTRPRACVFGADGIARNVMAMAERFQFGPADRLWSALPLCHVGGLYSFLAITGAGGAWLSQAHFEPGAALSLMKRGRATFAYPMFPNIVQALLEHPSYRASDLGLLRGFTHVGDEAALRRAQAALPTATEISAYGSTEVGGVAFGAATDPLEARVTTCGAPIRGVEIRIVSDELQVRGDGVLLGYHGFGAPATDGAGWFHTGDRAALDPAGRLRYLGRLTEMLKVGGENVSPAEVEASLTAHPAVRSAVVVGLPDPKLDQVPAAAVQLRPGASATSEDLIAHCAESLAAFKVPRHIVFVRRWPMSATKIRRDVVQRLVAEEARI